MLHPFFDRLLKLATKTRGKPSRRVAPVSQKDPPPDIQRSKSAPIAVSATSRLLTATAASQARADVVAAKKAGPVGMPSPPAPRGGKSRRAALAAADGIAKARKKATEFERHKQKQQQQQQLLPKVKSHARPPLTVPQTPKFATDAKLGEHKVAAGIKGSVPLARSSDIFGRGLRSSSATLPLAKNHKPRPTIPQSPKFATTARHGEKANPASLNKGSDTSAQSGDFMKSLRADNSVASSSLASRASRRSTLTVPQAPHFLTTDRHGEKKETPGHDPSSGQPSDIFSRGLRGTAVFTNKNRGKPTIPMSPHFHALSKRELPKSSEEREMEIIQEAANHPFRAKPILKSSSHTEVRPVRKPEPRRLTMPAPFRFQSDERAAAAPPPPPTPSLRDEEDARELEFKFRARPMPAFTKQQQKPPEQPKPRIHTSPQPFALSVSTRPNSMGVKEDTMDEDTVEMAKQFKARPSPRSTWKSPTLPVRSSKSVDMDKTKGQPPQLSTGERRTQRAEVAETSRKNVATMVEEKERQAKKRQAERHKALMAQSSVGTSPHHAASNAKPFNLQSASRHEEFQRKQREKAKQEEEERRKAATFRARKFHAGAPPDITPSRHVSNTFTTPEPFQLGSLSRHQEFTQGQRQWLQEQESRQKEEATFRARALPKSTYTPTVISPTSRQMMMSSSSERRESPASRYDNGEGLRALPGSPNGHIPTSSPDHPRALNSGVVEKKY